MKRKRASKIQSQTWKTSSGKPLSCREKIKTLNTENLVIKAQIHAGGRGKAGGIKILNNLGISKPY